MRKTRKKEDTFCFAGREKAKLPEQKRKKLLPKLSNKKAAATVDGCPFSDMAITFMTGTKSSVQEAKFFTVW